MPKIKPRSSRRAPPLKDNDYDHEISLFDSAADDAEVDAGGAAERSASLEAPETSSPASDTALETGDGAADNGTSRRPSALAVAPSRPASSPMVKSTSATPLLNTLSTVPTAVTDAGPSRSTSRGRYSTRYGSISKVVSGPLDGTPSVQVEDATPDGNVPNSSGGKGKQQERQQQQQSEQGPAPIAEQPGRQSMQSVRLEPEAAIDILFENERGGFLCGIPLFSRQALGNLDPLPWTNYAHGTSPTDIHSAQVPDPSWEWAWPEWRINQGDGEDEDGWEYSFMFAKFFSWHGPTWYNSFVRRRAWIRKRVKRKTTAAMSAAASAIGLGEIDSVTDPHLLNAEYFTVVSAASMRRSSSRGSSRLGSRLSLAAPPSVARSSKSGRSEGEGGGQGEDDSDDVFKMPKEITDADALMFFLRAARIDREKIEAVGNFVQYGGEDLVRLQDVMHEIMALFVFQASRQTLLIQLTKAHDAAVQTRQKETDDAEPNKEKEEAKTEAKTGDREAADTDKGKTEAAEDAGGVPAPPSNIATDPAHKLQALGRRVGYLTAAVKHADEEVRRLEYWSDIKAMAQRGGAINGAIGEGEGWDAQQWQGVDGSGPAPPPTKPPTKPPKSQEGTSEDGA